LLSIRRNVQQFAFPFHIYRDNPHRTPPLESEARLMLDRRRHPFYRHSDAAFFLVTEGRRAVGRIAALDNRNYTGVWQNR
jgi:hypothetical protein